MDYGDGRLNGEYQFNSKYRKTEMCRVLSRRVDSCGGNFAPSTRRPTPAPTLPPTSAAPSAAPSGAAQSCGYGLEACRRAAQRANLKSNGFAWYSFAGDYKHTGCYAHTTGVWKGYAWYGLGNGGAEVQGEAELTAVGDNVMRLTDTHSCSSATCDDMHAQCAEYRILGYCPGPYEEWM